MRNKKTKGAIKQKLGCKFIIIGPGNRYFNIFRAINEVFRQIKQWAKNNLVNKIAIKLIELEFKSDSKKESKAIQFIAKMILPDYKYKWEHVM